MKVPMCVAVGKKYWVPCVKDRNDKWFPIVGPAHIDGPELCQTELIEHYHTDRRFIDDSPGPVGYRGYGAIQHKLLTCIRTESDNGTIAFAMLRLARLLEKATIDLKDPVCPHNRQVVVNESGKCPGHGFCWDMKTGRPKWKAPFFVRFKGTPYKYPASDLMKTISMPYPIEATVRLEPAIVEIIDSEDQVIGIAAELQYNLAPGDTYKITLNCP